MTFESFLSGTPAEDYIFQDEEYGRQIERAVGMIREADYILLGAGAGLSTAAGAQYGGRFFEENFGEFQKKYGKGPYMQDMYSAGFYPFPDEESFWGYWSKQAICKSRTFGRKDFLHTGRLFPYPVCERMPSQNI